MHLRKHTSLRTSWKETGWTDGKSQDSEDVVDMLEVVEKEKDVLRVSAQRSGQNVNTEIQSTSHASEKFMEFLLSLAYVG